MKNIVKYVRHRETGFTLIELLIVIAVLGILAGAIIPNVSGFLKASKVAAANAELASVQTCAQVYYVDHADSTADFTSTALFADGYISSVPKYGTYTFYFNAILHGDPVYTSTAINWDALNLKWVKS